MNQPPKTKKQKPSAKARRSAARLAAVQALYQIALIGADVETVVGEFVQHRFGADLDGDVFVTPEPTSFAAIVRGASVRREDVDGLIAGSLDSAWTVDRLELLLRVVMRAGAWELLANPEVAPRIVISEYVDVAHAFFGGKEPAMVNGVLDKIARTLRPDEMTAVAGG
ncbi:transcription antitermination factor NusB [Inquilinus sp. CAU 1745]|uniref:transcription antitermination factor NusB n=1 Tax=Inquilinus sp. CAU 1745 TaxID=3140369 RepID=UPI00325BD9AE